jgi:WD40 repeat protein
LSPAAFRIGAPSPAVPFVDPDTGRNVPLGAMAVSPNGDFIAASSEGYSRSLWVWRLADLTGWRVVTTGADGEGLSLSFSPDGALLAGAGDGRAVHRVADDTRPFLLPEPPSSAFNYYAATSVRFSPDGKLLAVGGWGPYAFLVDTADGHLRGTYDSGMQSPSLAFSHDSQRLATSVPEMRRLADGALLWSAPAPTVPDRYGESTVELSPDEKTLLVSLCSGDVPDLCKTSTRLYDAETGELVMNLADAIPRRPQFLPIPGYLLAGARIIDLVTRASTALPVEARFSLYLPDGRIAAAGPDGVIRLVCAQH